MQISKLLQEIVFELISNDLPECVKKTIKLENEAIPMVNHLIFSFSYRKKSTSVALHEDQIRNKLGQLEAELGVLSQSYFMRQND